MKKTLRRLTAAMLCLCLLAPWLAAEATNVDSSLTVGIQSTKTTTIRPLAPLERDMMSVYDLVYESLVEIDDDYLPTPSLAESWSVSSGAKTWTFTLRQNVFFSDGTPLTARDVVATAEYILSRATDTNLDDNGYYRNLQYFVSSITAQGDYTVVVKAARSYWGVLYAMTFPILPADRLDSDNPPGTGAYKITTFEPGSYVWLQQNEYWWQTKPQVEEITFVCHKSAKEVIESYEYARVDAAFTRSIAAAQYKSGTSSLALDYRTNQLETIQINQGAVYLDSLNLRMAIRYLIDPDKIASTIYMGMVVRTDTPMIPGTWMYDTSIKLQTNVEKAKELLAADGWEDSNEDGVLDRVNSEGKTEKLHLRLYAYEEPDNDVRVETVNYIADVLATVGIETATQTLTMVQMNEKLKAGSYDLALVSYAMDVCPDCGFMLMPGNTGNYSRYRSSDMKTLFEELRKTTSQSEYQAKLFEIQKKFIDDCPFICLFYRAGSVLTRKMYTTARDVRELELLRGIELFHEE